MKPITIFKTLTGLVWLVAVIMCVSCDGPVQGSTKRLGGYLKLVELENGLECVRFKTSNAGGLSCNWEKFNKQPR